MFAMRAVCLWPGLPNAWGSGLARGLLAAVVFSWFVSFLLLATFVWPDWISSGLLRLLWIVACLTWIYSVIRNHMSWPAQRDVGSMESAREFIVAQAEYLRGNWFEAEAILLEILHRHPRDAEATLLLVGVLRHTKRWPAALRRLKQLQLIDAAAGWRFEIEREEKLIERLLADERASDAEAKVEPTSLAPAAVFSAETSGAEPSVEFTAAVDRALATE